MHVDTKAAEKYILKLANDRTRKKYSETNTCATLASDVAIKFQAPNYGSPANSRGLTQNFSVLLSAILSIERIPAALFEKVIIYKVTLKYFVIKGADFLRPIIINLTPLIVSAFHLIHYLSKLI